MEFGSLQSAKQSQTPCISLPDWLRTYTTMFHVQRTKQNIFARKEHYACQQHLHLSKGSTKFCRIRHTFVIFRSIACVGGNWHFLKKKQSKRGAHRQQRIHKGRKTLPSFSKLSTTTTTIVVLLLLLESYCRTNNSCRQEFFARKEEKLPLSTIIIL